LSNKATERNEHMAIAKEEVESFGLDEQEYVRFCRDLEACRNEKGKWDYTKVKAFAKELLKISDDDKGHKKRKYERYLKEHDPLEINPWRET